MTYQPDIAPWPQEFAGKLPVTETFFTLQGEGRFAGTPAAFIRLKYCNLGCAWCDTRFTWEQRTIEAGELFDPQSLATRVVAILPKGADPEQVHVVLTGGEPMLHQDRLPDLIDELYALKLVFSEIETNGMYIPSDDMLERISWWNCSPKLTNNGLPSSVNIVPSALRAIAATKRADFKFVVQSPGDIAEITRDFEPLVGAENIILMPEGITPKSQLSVMPWLMEECVKQGFRFSPRLHILAWGNQRGR